MSSSSACRSRISLWYWITKTPCWQIIPWSTVNMLPQRHTDGLSGIGQSYQSLIKTLVFERNNCKPIGCAFFTGQVHGFLCLVWQYGLHLLKLFLLAHGVYQSLYLRFFWGLMGLCRYFAYKWNSNNNNNNNNNGNLICVFECTIVNLSTYRQFTNAAWDWIIKKKKKTITKKENK